MALIKEFFPYHKILQGILKCCMKVTILQPAT